MRPLLLGGAFANVLLVFINTTLEVGWEYLVMNVVCCILCYIGYVNTFKEDEE